MGSGNARLEAALGYSRAGWNVVPLSGKRPMVPWARYQKTRVVEAEIRDWWARWPDANVGVVTGAISGLVVLDVDGEEGLRALSEQGLAVPSTLTSKTGGGGFHHLFRHPGGGQTIRSFVRKLPGLDLRGDGGIIVVPPSVHPNGTPYKWANDEHIADPPAWLLELAHEVERAPVTPADWACDVERGGRNAHLTRLAGSLMVRMGRNEAMQVLMAWNLAKCKPPLTEAEVEVIVDSIANREAAKPDPTPHVEAAAEAAGEGKRKPGQFRVMGFAEALDQYGLGEVDWAIDGWLPAKTVGLVVAPPGTYKTWLLLNLALAVSTGKPFLGHYPVNRPGPVLVIQQEDPFPMLFGRLTTMMGIGPATVTRAEDTFGSNEDVHEVPIPPPPPDILWHPDRSLNFERPESVAGLCEVVEQCRPVLVIMDPLYSMGSTDDYMAKTAQSMLVLKQLRDEYGCSFMIAHHTSKSKEGGTGREQAWGSQFLNAWLETGWQVRSTDNDKTILVRRHSKLVPPMEPIRISFDITPWEFKATVEGAADTLEDRIQEAMALGRQFKSINALASYIGCSKSTAHDLIRRMGLTKNDAGYYGV